MTGRASGDAFARREDPKTSHQAAASVSTTYLEEVVVDALQLRPSTSKEIAAWAGLHVWSISPRMKPLERRGIIMRTTQRRANSTVWELAKGIAA